MTARDLAFKYYNMSNFKLYELPLEFEQVETELIERLGELTPELEERINALNVALEDRVEAIAVLIRRNELLEEALQSEVDRLKGKQISYSRTADSLRSYLQRNLEALNRNSVKTNRFSISLCSNSRPRIIFSVDPEQLPEEYQMIIPAKITINKQVLLDDWQAGRGLPEGVMIERGRHIRIE